MQIPVFEKNIIIMRIIDEYISRNKENEKSGNSIM